jgi:flagellin
MPQVINTNVLSLVAQNNLNVSQQKQAQAVKQLSSGLRINSAADDPAGLAIAQRMQSQVNGMNQAVRNANDAIGMANTGDGALGAVGNMLQTMRTLAVQSANGTNGTGDQANLDAEYQQLASEVQRQLSTASFNGINILASTAATQYQIGANATDTLSVAAQNLAGSSSAAISGATNGSVASTASASAAITAIDTALTAVNSARANFGSDSIRFNQIVSTLQINSQNTAAAESQIMDTDYAQATAQLTQAQIVQQAGTAMLAQANMIPQNVLSLMKNL